MNTRTTLLSLATFASAAAASVALAAVPGAKVAVVAPQSSLDAAAAAAPVPEVAANHLSDQAVVLDLGGKSFRDVIPSAQEDSGGYQVYFTFTSTATDERGNPRSYTNGATLSNGVDAKGAMATIASFAAKQDETYRWDEFVGTIPPGSTVTVEAAYLERRKTGDYKATAGQITAVQEWKYIGERPLATTTIKIAPSDAKVADNATIVSALGGKLDLVHSSYPNAPTGMELWTSQLTQVALKAEEPAPDQRSAQMPTLNPDTLKNTFAYADTKVEDAPLWCGATLNNKTRCAYKASSHLTAAVNVYKAPPAALGYIPVVGAAATIASAANTFKPVSHEFDCTWTAVLQSDANGKIDNNTQAWKDLQCVQNDPPDAGKKKKK